MQQNQETERPIVAGLNYEVRARLDVSWAEYVLLDMVYHLSAKHGYCYKAYSSIARDLGITFTGTKKMIARLVARELLIEEARGLKCGSGYLDGAYLQKIPKKAKNELSSERKNKKVELSSKNELSSKKMNLVQKNELSSDEINNRYTVDITLDKSKVGVGKNPEKDELSVLYYQAIKTLGLPTRNHNNVKSTIGKLHAEIPHKEAVDYLNFMISFFKAADWDFKPHVTEALDIYAKREQIIQTFKKAQKEQIKHQPVRFGVKR